MPEGEKALAEHKGKAEDFFRKIRTEFLEWQREKFKKEAIITTHPNQNIDESDEKEIEEKGASFFRKDNLEEDSQQTIIDYIEKKDPWEMQELVAALLKSMGYIFLILLQEDTVGFLGSQAFIPVCSWLQ